MTEITSDKPSFTLAFTREFDAPRELVFECWTDAKHLAQWWGPTGFTNPVCEADARVGGRIYIEMTDPDGTAYPMSGEFLEIDPPSRLVFTGTAFEDENGVPGLADVNTVIFEAIDGGKTRVSFTSVTTINNPAFAESQAGAEEGWGQMLDRLAELLASVQH